MPQGQNAVLFIEEKGIKKTLRKYCVEHNLPYQKIYSIVHRKKCTVEYALEYFKTMRQPKLSGIPPKHGLWSTWNGMKQRCYNPNSMEYKRYGARGISIFQPWLDDPREFVLYCENVLGWTLELKKKNYTIDRIDNNGNYEPGNIRFVDKKTQSINRRVGKQGITRKIEFNGMTYTAREFGELIGMNYRTVCYRLDKGMTPQEIIDTPLKQTQKKNIPNIECSVTDRKVHRGGRKLSDDIVREIRYLADNRIMSQEAIAKKFGICRNTVQRIYERRSRKDVI